jgi:hypothetical protein
MILQGATSTRPLLEGVRAALEDSLLAIADRSDATEIADTLREGIALLSRLVEDEVRDADALEALSRTSRALGAARERLANDEVIAKRIEGAARWLSDASERLRGRLPARPGAAASIESDELVASVGVPRAHAVAVPPPRVLSREEASAAEGARGRLEASRSVAGEIAQIRAIARDCFEDIASLGSLRKLYDHEPWVDAGPFEQRLLDNLDALVSLERPLDPAAPSLGLVESLFAYAIEWVVPDFGRTFALAFTLCCLDSETAMRWVVLALRRSHPRTYPAFIDAFALGSNASIDRTLVELCREDEPALVEVALEAMARRGRVDMASAVLLLMRPAPTPSLLDKAIDLAARLPAQAAAPLLGRLVDGSDPAAAASAAAALMTLGDPRGVKHLRAVLQRPRTGDARDLRARRVALEALCLLGSPFDRNLVGTEASLDRQGLPWLGWHGHPDHVPVLIEGLRRAAAEGAYDEGDRIARALERIGGGSAPRPGALVGDFDERLAVWLRAFEERRPMDNPRMRFGQVWAPMAIVAELSARDTRQGERPILARELGLVTRRAAHLDVSGWVVVQERALAAARDLLPRQT